MEKKSLMFFLWPLHRYFESEFYVNRKDYVASMRFHSLRDAKII
jgi:hypothetical protein